MAKKVLLTILVIAILVSLSAAQTANGSGRAWKTISNENEEIDFEIPANEFRNLSVARDEPYLYFGSYSSKNDESLFFVKTSRNVSSTDFEAALKLASLFENNCATKDFGIYRSYECSFAESEFHFHTFKFIRTFKRVYGFYTVTPSGSTSDTQKFLESPRLTRELEGLKTIGFAKIDKIWNRFTAGDFEPKPKLSKKVFSTQDRKKYGSSDRTDRVLHLVTKPRPGYTEMARRFAITGSVRLRVTFNADGSVGNLEVLQALPFGLTQKAKDAASAIQFEPEVRGDRAIAIKKNISYNFSIY